MIRSILFTTNDCMDAGGRATHGAVAEARSFIASCSSCLRGDSFYRFITDLPVFNEKFPWNINA